MNFLNWDVDVCSTKVYTGSLFVYPFHARTVLLLFDMMIIVLESGNYIEGKKETERNLIVTVSPPYAKLQTPHPNPFGQAPSQTVKPSAVHIHHK